MATTYVNLWQLDVIDEWIYACKVKVSVCKQKQNSYKSV